MSRFYKKQASQDSTTLQVNFETRVIVAFETTDHQIDFNYLNMIPGEDDDYSTITHEFQ